MNEPSPRNAGLDSLFLRSVSSQTVGPSGGARSAFSSTTSDGVVQSSDMQRARLATALRLPASGRLSTAWPSRLMLSPFAEARDSRKELPSSPSLGAKVKK